MSAFLDQIREITELKLPGLWGDSGILAYIKKLAPYEIAGKPVLDDLDTKLSQSIQKLCVLMFTERKASNKSFTLSNNSRLKKIQLDDDGTLTPEDELFLYNYFRNNIEAFHEIVSLYYIPKRKQNAYRTCNEIFYIQSNSRFCEEVLDLFIVNLPEGLKLITENSDTENDPLSNSVDLFSFVNDYLGKLDNASKASISAAISDKNMSHQELQCLLSDIFKKFSNNINKQHGFLTGAISFFDFLGWKGIWQNYSDSVSQPLENVTELIESIKNIIQEKTCAAFPKIPINKRLSQLISISDTIAIFTPKVSSIRETSLLSLHANIARFILESASKAGYPIRGAISYGQYSTMHNVMIGPGIDECASWHETCDWIGAHFTPSAQFVLSNAPQSDFDNICAFDNIPLKAGIPRVKYCVKWEISISDFEVMRKKVQAVLPSIAAKYFNTYDFLFTKKAKNSTIKERRRRNNNGQ